MTKFQFVFFIIGMATVIIGSSVIVVAGLYNIFVYYGRTRDEDTKLSGTAKLDPLYNENNILNFRSSQEQQNFEPHPRFEDDKPAA